MAIPILVIDASPESRPLLRRSLEQRGRYRVHFAASAAEALAAIRDEAFRLAIVDFGVPDLAGEELIRQLRLARPGLAVIAVPAGRGPADASFDDLGLAGVLTKPFYLPALPELVSRALGLPARAGEAPLDAGLAATEAFASAGAQPPWSLDPDHAAQHLARLARDSGAYAILLTRSGRVWAYAGGIPQSHVAALAQMLSDRGVRAGLRDAVARFVRMPGSVDDFLLYSFAIGEGFLASLVYPARVPLATIRHQAQRLMSGLAAPSGSGETSAAPPEGADRVQAAPRPGLPRDWLPDASTARLDWAFQPSAAGSPTPGADAGASSSPTSLPDDWRPQPGQPAALQAALGAPPADQTPVSAYTLILVPRLAAHRLTEALADHLRLGVEQICQERGWQALAVDIRPDYLSLTLSLPAGVSSAAAAQRARLDLSGRLLRAFPDLANGLQAGMFWARGYLLTPGGPAPPERIQAFVRQAQQTETANG